MNRKRMYFAGPGKRLATEGRRNERGQAIVVLVIWFVFVLAMAAVVADLGTVYLSYRQLQASTDAAALAAGQALPSTSTTLASNAASLYGAVSGGMNVYSSMTSVSMVSGYPKFLCSTTLSGMGLGCSAATPIYNAVTVKQQATVPLNFLNYFSAALGAHPSMKIATSATASGRMANGGPYNVVIILDTTVSMQDGDGDAANNPNCNGQSKIQCATQGIQTFLANITPCYTIPCNSNPLNVVALMVFPGFVTSGGNVLSQELSPVPTGTYPWYVADEYNGSSPSIGASNISQYKQYNGSGGASNMVEEYEIVPFSSDYWASTATKAPAALNTSSNLVKAVLNAPYYTCSGGGSCVPPVGGPPWGLADVGGEGTFYAGVITAAQDALVAEQALRPGTQNVIILLSDGDATATSSQLSGGYTTTNECTQAVTAAQAATTATPPTRVIAVAYGAESTGCSGDANYAPCTTMQNIASVESKDFFSDDTTAGSGAGCTGAALTSTNLQQIFVGIANSFKNSQLIPNSTP